MLVILLRIVWVPHFQDQRIGGFPSDSMEQSSVVSLLEVKTTCEAFKVGDDKGASIR